MQRLDDAEFGRRQRERNLRANRQRRERLTLAGYAQWNLWIHGEIRALAERLADERTVSPSELVAELIKSAALSSHPAQALMPRASLDADATVDRFSESDTRPGETDSGPALSRDERDRQILELHHQGLKNPEIGKRFNTSEGSIRRALIRAKKATT